MKIKNYIILLSLALLGSACERTLDFEDPADETVSDMVINAVAIADTSFSVYLNRAYLINQTPSLQYRDYEHSIQVNDEGSYDYRYNDYYENTAIENANVEIKVNGQKTYQASFSNASHRYESSYVPREGDHIVITANSGNQELSTETVVPTKPKISVTGYEVIPDNPYKNINGLTFDTDTIMRLTCRISGTAGEHYYRLRIRSERDEQTGVAHREDGKLILDKLYTNYVMQDVYFSTDELFADNRLKEGFGGWPSYFSNVFDNTLMGGSDYTFTVDSPKIRFSSPSSAFIRTPETEFSDKPLLPARVMVELQAISEEYYLYLKSYQLYRVTVGDRNAEPILIYSNVQNGWGILGALSYDRHFVEFGD